MPPAASIAIAVLTLPSASLAVFAPLHVHVDCMKGIDSGAGTYEEPLQTVHEAQRKIRRLRFDAQQQAVVHITGVCELAATLHLVGAIDSNIRYVGTGAGAMLSGGTALDVPDTASTKVVDLTKYGLSSATLGVLKGRGYSGGSACIEVTNFEASAAELFYRPGGMVRPGGSNRTWV